MEVKTLLDLNNTMQTKTLELENRIAEAHKRYVASKTKGDVARKTKRSISGVINESQPNFSSKNAMNEYSGKQSVRSGRNLSMGTGIKRDEHSGTRSHSSSYAFLHLTKDLESIYKEFEAGEMNELNKLRRLVSHFIGLSRRV